MPIKADGIPTALGICDCSLLALLLERSNPRSLTKSSHLFRTAWHMFSGCVRRRERSSYDAFGLSQSLRMRSLRVTLLDAIIVITELMDMAYVAYLRLSGSPSRPAWKGCRARPAPTPR